MELNQIESAFGLPPPPKATALGLLLFSLYVNDIIEDIDLEFRLSPPQGTALGLLLFSLHVNDIIEDIDLELRLFFAVICVCYRDIKDGEGMVKLQDD